MYQKNSRHFFINENNIYIYLLFLFFVSNKRKNSGTIGPNFFVGPHIIPGKVHNLKIQFIQERNIYFTIKV